MWRTGGLKVRDTKRSGTGHRITPDMLAIGHTSAYVQCITDSPMASVAERRVRAPAERLERRDGSITQSFARVPVGSSLCSGFTPHLKPVELKLGDVVATTDGKVTRVLFPHSGVISLVVELTNGQMIETAMVGRDGVFKWRVRSGRQSFSEQGDRAARRLRVRRRCRSADALSRTVIRPSAPSSSATNR